MKPRNKQGFIVIWSIDSDQSTSEIIDWLIRYKQSFLRINAANSVELRAIYINQKEINIVFKYGERFYNTENIKSFWYRRGDIKGSVNLNAGLNESIKWYLGKELTAALQFLETEFNKKAKVNSFYNRDINKLVQLAVAKECNLLTPDTLVTNNISNAESFLKKNGRSITKSIHVPFSFFDERNNYALMTSDFNSEDLGRNANDYFLTKFQQKIDKKFDLRIFYLKKEFFCMAIFSQSNPKTSTDFRNYDNSNPNRRVPFILPDKIKNGLIKFMKRLKLNCGSIDMIVDINDDFYFLEVNPVGQFGMVSHSCNYFIEERIAKILINDYV